MSVGQAPVVQVSEREYYIYHQELISGINFFLFNTWLKAMFETDYFMGVAVRVCLNLLLLVFMHF